jgi:NADH dehydrogenase [ubiquinone] 1 alpha subcomplex assembly factor 7
LTGASEGQGLAQILARRIRLGGPITVADYMAAALGDAKYGDYRRGTPIGAKGDFTTAPEISQMFGELIGAWLIDCWDQGGGPEPVRLVELGPGRGTLLCDALRVGARRPDWRRALDLHLVEIHPGFREAQAARLGDWNPRWHDTLASVPEGPLLLVANEFFDAMPIRQLMFHDGAWRERMIGWTEADGFHFVLALSASPLAMLLQPGAREGHEGDVIEVSPPSLGLAAEIGLRVGQYGGAALIVDYGRLRTTPGVTLQAVRDHRRAELLAEPGFSDLSAHVDFDMLGRSARETGAAVHGPVTQGDFLRALGIDGRAEALKAGGSMGSAHTIDSSVERLCGETAMGILFKVMAITAPGIDPAGFAP